MKNRGPLGELIFGFVAMAALIVAIGFSVIIINKILAKRFPGFQLISLELPANHEDIYDPFLGSRQEVEDIDNTSVDNTSVDDTCVDDFVEGLDNSLTG